MIERYPIGTVRRENHPTEEDPHGHSIWVWMWRDVDAPGKQDFYCIHSTAPGNIGEWLGNGAYFALTTHLGAVPGTPADDSEAGRA